MIFNRDNAGIFGLYDYDFVETIHRDGSTSSATRRAVDGKYIATPTVVGPFQGDEGNHDFSGDPCSFIDELYDDSFKSVLAYDGRYDYNYSYSFSGGKIFFGSSGVGDNFFYVYDPFLKTISRFCETEYIFLGHDIVTAWPNICLYDYMSSQIVLNAITCAESEKFVYMEEFEEIACTREFNGKAYVMLDDGRLYVQNGDYTRRLIHTANSWYGFAINRMEIYTVTVENDIGYLNETDILGGRTNKYRFPDWFAHVSGSKIVGILGDFLYFRHASSETLLYAFNIGSKIWAEKPCEASLTNYHHVYDCDAVSVDQIFYITPAGEVRRIRWK